MGQSSKHNKVQRVDALLPALGAGLFVSLLGASAIVSIATISVVFLIFVGKEFITIISLPQDEVDYLLLDQGSRPVVDSGENEIVGRKYDEDIYDEVVKSPMDDREVPIPSTVSNEIEYFVRNKPETVSSPVHSTPLEDVLSRIRAHNRLHSAARIGPSVLISSEPQSGGRWITRKVSRPKESGVLYGPFATVRLPKKSKLLGDD